MPKQDQPPRNGSVEAFACNIRDPDEPAAFMDRPSIEFDGIDILGQQRR